MEPHGPTQTGSKPPCGQRDGKTSIMTWLRMDNGNFLLFLLYIGVVAMLFVLSVAFFTHLVSSESRAIMATVIQMLGLAQAALALLILVGYFRWKRKSK